MSTFGRFFRVTTFGESHCKGVGCIVDGVPPSLALTEADIQPQLTRRRPGQSKLTTPRDEKDNVTIMSGTEKGFTLGTPLALFVPNENVRPKDYKEMDLVPRPGHADYTYQMKYGTRASSGGGRASARETIGRVASGAVAEKWLKEKFGTSIVCWVSSIGTVDMPRDLLNDPKKAIYTREDAWLTDDLIPVRCPHPPSACAMSTVVRTMKVDEDSTGGVVTCVIRNAPVGLGEPCFDKMQAVLAHAMMSIPATKGFEIGSGFSGTSKRGSEHNDPFCAGTDAEHPEKLSVTKNDAGGVLGGITSGADIYFRVAIKPVSTIGRAQPTVGYDGKETVLEAKGRHDPCVLPRVVPLVEAMSALAIADAAMIQLARDGSKQDEPAQKKRKL
eukprot:jgi/Phyca11/112512/e_gw1.22.37.1